MRRYHYYRETLSSKTSTFLERSQFHVRDSRVGTSADWAAVCRLAGFCYRVNGVGVAGRLQRARCQTPARAGADGGERGALVT